MRNRWIAIALLAVVLACKSNDATAPEVCAATNGAPAPVPGPAHAPFSVLVFSRTTGYRHASIPSGITAIQVLGALNNFTVEATEDPTAFSDANLARFGAVVFLSTTGEVLDDAQQAAFERYIQAGHGSGGRALGIRHGVWLELVPHPAWRHVRVSSPDAAGQRGRRGHGPAVHALPPRSLGAHR